MNLVMPWFFPLAAFSAVLGLCTARDLWPRDRTARTDAIWLVVVMNIPLIFWLIAQVLPKAGDLP